MAQSRAARARRARRGEVSEAGDVSDSMHIQIGARARGVSNAEIAQPLCEFSLVEDIEVVVAGLPELLAGDAERPGGLPLQYSQGIVRAFRIGLAEQKVHVFGHEKVSRKGETAGGGRLQGRRGILFASDRPRGRVGGFNNSRGGSGRCPRSGTVSGGWALSIVTI